MNRILITLILCVGVMFSQSAESRSDGQTAMQNLFIDAIDSTAFALKTTTQAHHEVHEGNHFEVAGSFSLASADTSLIVFDVADTTKISHMIFSFDVLAATTIVISEGGAYIRAPDTLNVVNNNRNSSIVSIMDTVFAIHNDSTLISRYGTTLFTHTLGAGQKTAGTLKRESELLLKNDSLFIIKITSDAASNKVDYEFLWYEHESGSD